MKILAIESECIGAHPGQIQSYLKPEALKVWDLYQKGVIRESYFHAERHEAVLILECDNLTAAQEVIQTLPLVREGLITFTLLPLVPYDGFARLFATTVVCQETLS